MPPPPPSPTQTRASITARMLAATVGGYALAAAMAVALGTLIPGERAGAAAGATLVALLLVWPVTAMACFRAARAWRAWGFILAGTAAALLAALAGGWRP